MDKLNKLLKNVFNKNSLKLAIDTENESMSYRQLNILVSNISHSIIEESKIKKFTKILIFGYRSIDVYAALLASVITGVTFIPLNPYFPNDKIINIIKNSESEHIILLDECYEKFTQIYNDVNYLKIFHSRNIDSSIFTQKIIINNIDSLFLNDLNLDTLSYDNPCYIIFTSGTTGDPKGVIINRDSIYNYVIRNINLFKITSNDIFSQMSDISFDLSMLDIFCSFSSGACLCVIPKKYVINPIKYLITKNVTIFVSVPSIIGILNQIRVLRDGILPNIRLSLFCGEAFTRENAYIWSKSVPNSEIYNLYGPTEATVSFTEFQFKINENIELNGVLPIGKPYPGLFVKLFHKDPSIDFENAIEGEIFLGGDQISAGYLNDYKKTNDKFFKENNIIWYKTGDLGRYITINNEKYLFFIGRMDDQIKINGYRVELQEVDNILKEITGMPSISVAIKNKKNNLQRIYGIIETKQNLNKNNIINKCKEKLNPYAVPYDIFTMEKFIVNNNGKTDRKAITKYISTSFL